MDILLIFAGSLLIAAGFIGSLLPVLPGPLLGYAGLLLLQLTSSHPFSWQFLAGWGLLVAVLALLDSILPAWGSKKFGGSPYGIAGSLAGGCAGIFFFPPWGIVGGPLVGAFVGELIGRNSSKDAFSSAVGSFFGLLFNTVLQIIACGMMGYYFILNM